MAEDNAKIVVSPSLCRVEEDLEFLRFKPVIPFAWDPFALGAEELGSFGTEADMRSFRGCGVEFFFGGAEGLRS